MTSAEAARTMAPSRRPAGTFEGALVSIDGRTVGLTGPSGIGKTALLLELARGGGLPVAFERARVEGGAVRRDHDNVRIRAHHLHQLGDLVRLTGAQRFRLHLGALAMRVPRIGRRIGRRCFVDLPDSAIGRWGSADRVDLVVVLDPGERSVAAPPIHLTGVPTVSIPTYGRTTAEVAVAVRQAAAGLPC